MLHDQGTVLSGKLYIDVVDADNLHLSTADRFAADRECMSGHANKIDICCIRMFGSSFLIDDIFIGDISIFGNLKGIPDSLVICRESKDTTKKRPVCTMSVIGLRKRAV